MEEGSLLTEALDYMGRLREGGNSNSDQELGLQNALQIDVYDLDHLPATGAVPSGTERIRSFQSLAELSMELNQIIKDSGHPWIMGGDGPVFGIHVSDGYPHLRAMCRYGDVISDEWKAVQIVLQFSKDHSNILVDCWDLDDGPLFLIQCAEGLPRWLEDGRELDVRHVCWIVNGQLTLIGPTDSVSLRKALELLKSEGDSHLLSKPPAMQQDLNIYLDSCLKGNGKEDSCFSQRTVALLPRPVAWMLHRRPALIPCIASFFEQGAQNSHAALNSQLHEDWVWTTLSMPRAQYAMLRTMVTPTWRSERYMPPSYKTVEFKRLVRTCQREATPHLRHAWQIGMRLTAGVDYVLTSADPNLSNARDMSIMEQRVLEGWTQIDLDVGGNGQWLMEAWKAGPNHAAVAMSALMKCPVFTLELNNKAVPCPLSLPGESLHSQIQRELKQKLSKKETAIDSMFVVPREADVDSEDWLDCGAERLNEIGPASSSTKQVKSPPKGDEPEIDSVLQGFQHFMGNKSDIEGVSHKIPITVKEPSTINVESQEQDPKEPVDINPRVFLNMLHAVLQSSPESISSLLQERDPFFSEQDYKLMDADSDSSDEDEQGTADREIDAVMEAMDDELRQKPGTSRSYDEVAQNLTNDSVAEDAHVLSNLLQSLDASGGAPGPVRNILREIGADLPVVQADTSSDDEADTAGE